VHWWRHAIEYSAHGRFFIHNVQLTANFTDGSSDSDGSVAGWSWDFDDGNGSSAQNPGHAYAASGTYSVSLTVTDDDGDQDTATHDVTVSDGSPGGGITLTGTGNKVRGVRSVDLSWDGAASSQVDIYRDGSLIATIQNSGSYSESLGRGGGTFTYQVCEAGTDTCSNEAVVAF